jgi:acylphosphatase
VEGRVQGVGFRYFVQQTANGLSLSGWVRNRLNGSVEVVAEGKRSTLDQLVDALRRGPRAANVTSTDISWEDPTGEFSRFQVRMTR